MILTSTVVFAQHRSPHGYVTGSHQHHYHHHRHYHGNDWRWVAPAIVTGAVVYAITRPPTVVQQTPTVVQQTPMVVQQTPMIVQQPDIVYIDGVGYRKQLMLINGYYQEVLVKI